MLAQKQRFMFAMSLFSIAISFLVYFLHRSGILSGSEHHHEFTLSVIFTLAVPLLLFIVNYLLYVKQQDHPILPYFTTLTLTFSSIATIFAGNGMIEYHFSIFMVLAILAFYEDVKLILFMTVLFAVHHLGSYFLMPLFAFHHEHYDFAMVLVHAVFLLFTSGAVIAGIYAKQKMVKELQEVSDRKQGTINHMMDQMKRSSEQLTAAAGSLTLLTKETTYAAEQIINHGQQVAAGSELQVQMAEEVFLSTEELSQGIKCIAETSRAVSSASLTSKKIAEEGKQQVDLTVQQMNSISQHVEGLFSSIEKLEERSCEIQQILSVIKGIADQTNLLALNAAIEAARAGVQGKGFAVVADEVRKLAEQASISTNQIAELIQHTRVDTQAAVQAMSTVVSEVEQGGGLVRGTAQTFQRIVDHTHQVSEDLQVMSAETEQMSASTGEVATSVGEMNQISVGATQSVSQVSLAADQQFISIKEISASCEKLSRMAKEMEELIGRVSASR